MNKEFQDFLDLLSLDALQTVSQALEAAFPEPKVNDPVLLSDERLRYDLQWKAGAFSSVALIRNYIMIRQETTPTRT